MTKSLIIQQPLVFVSDGTVFVNSHMDGQPIIPRIDDSRSVVHNLGFVPIVWIKNLPGADGDDIDGWSSSRSALDIAVRIDYQLSQADRALKYSADPLLLLKEPAQSDGPLVRSASNAIIVDKDVEAKLVEINGAATAAQLEFVHRLSGSDDLRQTGEPPQNRGSWRTETQHRTQRQTGLGLERDRTQCHSASFRLVPVLIHKKPCGLPVRRAIIMSERNTKPKDHNDTK
jgi:hypothetical protein